MKIVFFAILSLLAIVGISHIIFEIYFRLVKFENDDAFVVLFPKSDTTPDIEFCVRSMVAKSKKLCDFRNIICISDNLDDNSKKELSLLQKDYNYLKIISSKEFKEKAGL